MTSPVTPHLGLADQLRDISRLTDAVASRVQGLRDLQSPEEQELAAAMKKVAECIAPDLPIETTPPDTFACLVVDKLELLEKQIEELKEYPVQSIGHVGSSAALVSLYRTVIAESDQHAALFDTDEMSKHILERFTRMQEYVRIASKDSAEYTSTIRELNRKLSNTVRDRNEAQQAALELQAKCDKAIAELKELKLSNKKAEDEPVSNLWEDIKTTWREATDSPDGEPLVSAETAEAVLGYANKFLDFLEGRGRR